MRRLVRVLLVLLAALLMLAVPGPAPSVPDAPARGGAFSWDQDAYWRALEARYEAVREEGCPAARPRAGTGLSALRERLGSLASAPVPVEAPLLDSIERAYFELAPVVALCADLTAEYANLQGVLRASVKAQSQRWELDAPAARDRLYRLLYGSRLAAEEVLQHHPMAVPALQVYDSTRRALPAVEVAGVRIYSGDLLVSRGGYPTSALIARGNDYPGNFSHVALVHVDSATGAATAIEALIERGVVLTTPAAYLADKKLRIMVLRLRADLPALHQDPLLPHRAAARMLERARAGPIPYDFTMDYTSPEALFCSEVASWAYREEGVVLWTGLSTITRPGLRGWLAAFGVRHFETQEPSDLEYDPQLTVVAEWRSVDDLLRDRVDNAVIDAMLEGADAGDPLSCPLLALPVARLAKAWSWLAERTGARGPIPKGMPARAALQNRAFTSRQRAIAADVHDQIAVLERDQGYPLTYRHLVALAREATRRHPPS